MALGMEEGGPRWKFTGQVVCESLKNIRHTVFTSPHPSVCTSQYKARAKEGNLLRSSVCYQHGANRYPPTRLGIILRIIYPDIGTLRNESAMYICWRRVDISARLCLNMQRCSS